MLEDSGSIPTLSKCFFFLNVQDDKKAKDLAIKNCSLSDHSGRKVKLSRDAGRNIGLELTLSKNIIFPSSAGTRYQTISMNQLPLRAFKPIYHSRCKSWEIQIGGGLRSTKEAVFLPTQQPRIRFLPPPRFFSL